MKKLIIFAICLLINTLATAQEVIHDTVYIDSAEQTESYIDTDDDMYAYGGRINAPYTTSNDLRYRVYRTGYTNVFLVLDIHTGVYSRIRLSHYPTWRDWNIMLNGWRFEYGMDPFILYPVRPRGRYMLIDRRYNRMIDIHHDIRRPNRPAIRPSTSQRRPMNSRPSHGLQPRQPQRPQGRPSQGRPIGGRGSRR